MGIGVDWVSVLILLAAYVFSTVKSVPATARLWSFSVACFAIAGYRFWRGAVGVNLVFAGFAALLGVRYAWDAIKASRNG